MSPPQRMRAWGAAVSAAHLVAGGAGWLLLGMPPAFFAGCAVLTLGVALAGARLLERPPGDDDTGRGPPRTPDGGEPPWWPEFERAFRGYASDRAPAPARGSGLDDARHGA